MKKKQTGDKQMSKFYPHNISTSVRNSRIRNTAAKLQTNIPTLAESQILHLLEINEQGLPDCYKSFGEFLYDFWPDFSWNVLKSVGEITAVLNDARFKGIVESLNSEWNIDIVQELAEGITEISGM